MSMMTQPFEKFDKYHTMGAYHWDECARSSPRYNPPLEAKYAVLLKNLKKTNRILDLGCGDGYLTSLLTCYSDQVFGLDFEFSGVKLSNNKLQTFPQCRMLQGDSDFLPFKSETFDFITLADVIEHLENPDACLKESARVLVPGGTLLLTTPQWRPDRKWDPRHCKEYNPQELSSSLRTYFSEVSLSFFWPKRWYDFYCTKAGFKLLRHFSRHFYNPFLKEGSNPHHFYQILAVCRKPIRS